MIITIQFLISFLRDKIPDFDGRADSFRKKNSSKPTTGFTEEILKICQEQAVIENGRIEIGEGIHSKRDHKNLKYVNFRRIAGEFFSSYLVFAIFDFNKNTSRKPFFSFFEA